MPKAEEPAAVEPFIDETETAPPPPPEVQSATTVKVRITKMGAGKVSTGAHTPMIGDDTYPAGAMVDLPLNVAQRLEGIGFAEIQ